MPVQRTNSRVVGGMHMDSEPSSQGIPVRAGNLANGFAATCAIVVVFCALGAMRPSTTDVVGKVQGANRPIVGSRVTLYSASAGAPAQLAQGTTDDTGSFKLSVPNTSG